MAFNFTLLACQGLPSVISEIRQNDEFFGINGIRQYKGSAHSEIKDILLRGPPLSSDMSMIDLMNAIDCEDYYTMQCFPDCHQLILDIADYLGCKKLGRVIITKLEPGGAIYPHVDEGKVPEVYARFHYVIRGAPGNYFTVDGHTQEMRTGELWQVNIKKEHSVINQSDRDRIHLIMDVAQ